MAIVSLANFPYIPSHCCRKENIIIIFIQKVGKQILSPPTTRPLACGKLCFHLRFAFHRWRRRQSFVPLSFIAYLTHNTLLIILKLLFSLFKWLYLISKEMELILFFINISSTSAHFLDTETYQAFRAAVFWELKWILGSDVCGFTESGFLGVSGLSGLGICICLGK